MESHDPFDLAGNEKEARERKKQQRTANYLAGEDVKVFMDSKRGRRVMWQILEIAGLYRSSYTGNNDTFFREGMRNVGLVIVARIQEACPESFIQMLSEQKHERSSSTDTDNSADE